jgi:hypothetical protein
MRIESKEAGLTTLGDFLRQPPATTPAADTTPPGLKLTDLFVQISEAVIEAQAHLDQKSAEYVAGMKDPRLQPAVFSIPSVKAETKIAFTNTKGSNLLVKIIGSPEDKTSYSESTVTFDIVAAPPNQTGISPVPSFLVSGTDKDTVLAKAFDRVDDSLRERTVVFRTSRGAPKPYLIVMAPSESAGQRVLRVALDPVSTADEMALTDAAANVLDEIVGAIREWERSQPQPVPQRR